MPETTKKSIRRTRYRSTLRSVNTKKYYSFIHKFINIMLSNESLTIHAS